MVKVERSFPAPKSLAIEAKKTNGSYSEPDVIKQLSRDFHNKCYICELKGLQDPQVEHLLPHKNGKYPERKFDWNNLFWACSHCNNMKNQQKYDTGIIDCCKKDPELQMTFQMEEKTVRVEARDSTDSEAVLTAALIEETFNKMNTGMREYRSEKRFQELTKEMNLLFDNLEQLKLHPRSRVVMRKLEVLLRRESQFAAFKRDYVRSHAGQFQQLQEYCT